MSATHIPLDALQHFKRLCQVDDRDNIIKTLDKSPVLSYSHIPLVAAARKGHASLFEYLLTRGFNAFPEDNPEYIPAIATDRAVKSGDTGVLEVLLRYGWDISAGNHLLPDIPSKALENENIVRWYLDHGADPNAFVIVAIGNLSITTHAALRYGLPVLKILVSNGGMVANTNAIPLAVIGQNFGSPDRLQVVEYLLDNGAPIDAYANEGYLHNGNFHTIGLFDRLENGLHWATGNGRRDMVELLLKRGADKSMRTGDSSTPETALEIAESKGFHDIANLLR